MATKHHGERWFAYHDASGDEHKQYWKDRTGDDWYCISLSRSDSVDEPRFAAVWIHPKTPLAKQTQTHVAYDNIVAHMDGLPSGKIPAIITASGNSSEKPHFTVVTEDGTTPYLAKAMMEHDDFLAQCTASRNNGKILRWACAYPGDSDMRYAAIWVNDPNRVAWNVTAFSTQDAFQKRFDAGGPGWIRTSLLIPTLRSASDSSSHRFMASWTDALVTRYYAEGEVYGNDVSSRIEKHKDEGFMPVQIQALGLRDDRRYMLLSMVPDDVIDRGSENNPAPSPTTRYYGVRRKFHRHADSYSASPTITAALDSLVREDMENTGHRATALALARNGNLVFAAGYTYAEEGLYPETTPNDVFRVGSLSKPITAIAIHQLDEASPLLDRLFDRRVAQLIGLDFNDPQGEEMLVKHLLAHIGGLPKNAGPTANDKMEYDRAVADKLNNGKLPVDTDMALKFIAGVVSVSTPGAKYKYSNTGYELLGEAVRKLGGGNLGNYVRTNIFDRVGICLHVSTKAPRWGASEKLPSQDGEVRYHDSALGISITVAASSGKLVPTVYGGWNMGRIHGSGAWAISAPHYLRILSRFTLPAGANPLFSHASTAAKFTTLATPGGFTWGGLSVTSSGTTFSKGGAAPGARAQALFRTNGWSLVYLTNSDDGSDPNDSSDDGVKTAALQGWIDSAWNSIPTDPKAWTRVYVNP